MQDQNQLPPLPPTPSGVQAPNVPGGASMLGKSEIPAGGDGANKTKAPVVQGASGVSGGDVKKKEGDKPKEAADEVLPEVLDKIRESENVLVALSNDPSVDEMAAALALTMVLDENGRHATAIYSGKTPNILEFLNPEETFEVNTNSLQDFIIALNKDKADHLRYKIDGEYVKVFITPYKTTLDEGDLEFSRGDYNVDLVISINVPAATELDDALKEYGRIMHDATSINITNGAPGKFADLEWVNPKASSICEMVAKLAFELNKEVDAGIATALLTGIVAATDKFTNQETSPEVMMLAAKLMSAGADQQDIIKNVSQELVFTERKLTEREKKAKKSASEISINHKEEETSAPEESVPAPAETGVVAGVQGVPGQASQDSGLPGVQNMTNGGQPLAATPGAMTIAGVEVSSIPNDGGYNGGSVADQILNSMGAQGGNGMANVVQNGAGMENNGGAEMNGGQMAGGQMTNDQTTGGDMGAMETNPLNVDYGKMIDEALAEPLPGEAGATGMSTMMQMGAQPGGMEASGAGMTQMGMPGTDTAGMAQTGISGADVGMNGGMTGNGMSDTQMQAGNEFPPIVQTGGSLGYQAPENANPAMMQAPQMSEMSSGANDVPNMNFGGGTDMGMMNSGMSPEMNPSQEMSGNMSGNEAAGLPMPGQEIAPPPVAPMPDFATLPPVQGAEMGQGVSGMEAQTGGAGMSDLGVMTPMNGGNPLNSSAVVPAFGNAVQQPGAANPQDPGAFKIPGM